MKNTLLLALGLSCAASFAVEHKYGLKSRDFNGTIIEHGEITIRKEMAMQKDNEAVVIEAEKADTIFFQADVFARKAGSTGIDLQQIKRSASEYTPQTDIPDASNGKYIDFCQQATWQFSIKHAGAYRVWFRTQVPFVANWGHYIIVDDLRPNYVDVGTGIREPKTWKWLCGIECYMKEGIHQVMIRDFLNGKRMDQVMIAPASYRPENGDAAPATPMTSFSEGSVVFNEATPYGLKKWLRLDTQELPGVEWFASDDGGKNYSPVKPGDNLEAFGAKPLTMKATLKTVNGEFPHFPSPALSYDYDRNAFNILQTQGGQWFFAKENGRLSGIVSTTTGHEIQPVGLSLPMFTVFFKEPGKEERVKMTEDDAKFISAKLADRGKKLTEIWHFDKFDTDLILTLKADGDLLQWNACIDNRGEQYDVIEMMLPRLGSLKVGAKAADDTLAWPFSAGEFIKSPALKGTQKVAYPDHAGMGYTDLYTDKDGIFLGITDSFTVTSEIICDAAPDMSAVDLSITKKHRIAKGTKREYLFTTAVHAGDWHSGAKIYRDWFYKTHPRNAYRPWLRNIDGWQFGSSIGDTGRAMASKDYTVFRNDMIAAGHLNLDYIQSWGATFNGACPAYYLPRKEKGGEEMFAAMMKEWRDMGGKVGNYYFANGLAIYYLLSEKYFATPWSEYPEDDRPPSYDWFVKNRSYSDASGAQTPMDDIMKTIRQLNQDHAEGKILGGQAEECLAPLGGHLPMNWSNGEYPAFLYKWIDRYVSKYNCNTAYLDTFAFSNAQPDYNPYLGMNGEGDKPMHKVAFLKKLMKDMRAKEPDFCSLTEGVGDVFGAEGLYFLLSGFAKQPAMYRYTLPDHIFFQGGCNGLWDQPKMEESTRQAFLHGNRFDLVRIFPKVYHILKLKQSIAPFMNQSRFDDTTGVTVSSEYIDCFAHVCDKESDWYIANNGTRSVTLTMSNPTGIDGRISYKLPKGFKLNAAILCDFDKNPQKIDLQPMDGVVSFDAPKGFVSALVLIDQVKKDHSWTAYAEQVSDDTVVVRLFNFMPAKATLTVNLFGTSREIELAPYSGIAEDFLREGNNDKPELVKLSVSGTGITRNSIISIGGEFSSVASYRLEAPRVPKGGQLVMDFEEGGFPADNPHGGRHALRLAANGKFCYRIVHIALEPDTQYEIEFDMCKSVACNQAGDMCFAMMCNYNKDHNLERYLICAGNVPTDGLYHHVAGTFKTGPDVTSTALYIYNSNSENGVVHLDDLVIREK